MKRQSPNSTLFKNKYRIASARWQDWNYCNAGAYFITICTKDRQNYFGKCLNGFMCLDMPGTIAFEILAADPLTFYPCVPGYISGDANPSAWNFDFAKFFCRYGAMQRIYRSRLCRRNKPTDNYFML